MAATLTNKRLCKGTLSNSYTTLYTAPNTVATDYTVLKSLIICNVTGTNKAVSLEIAGVTVIFEHTVEGNDAIVIPFTDAILQAGETIRGMAVDAASVTYYISGIESTGS